MIERTQVGFAREEDGRKLLQVMGTPAKRRMGTVTVRDWVFGIVENNEVVRKFKMMLFPWESESLLLALGGVKEKNEVVWDPDTVDGKMFSADLSTEKYKDKKDNSEREKYVLKNCEKEF